MFDCNNNIEEKQKNVMMLCQLRGKTAKLAEVMQIRGKLAECVEVMPIKRQNSDICKSYDNSGVKMRNVRK
jgi:hypothetical protein